MIVQLAIFVFLIFVGSSVWFYLSYFANYIINWHITSFPQWSSMPQVVFLIAIVNWGLLLLLLIPAFIYLLTNTQRPEGPQ